MPKEQQSPAARDVEVPQVQIHAVSPKVNAFFHMAWDGLQLTGDAAHSIQGTFDCPRWLAFFPLQKSMLENLSLRALASDYHSGHQKCGYCPSI